MLFHVSGSRELGEFLQAVRCGLTGASAVVLPASEDFGLLRFQLGQRIFGWRRIMIERARHESSKYGQNGDPSDGDQVVLSSVGQEIHSEAPLDFNYRSAAHDD